MKGNSSLFILHPKYASGEIVFKSVNYDFFEYISRRKDVDVNGVIDIVAHGSTDTIQIEHNGKRQLINSRTLAKIIKRKNKNKIRGVRMLSCNTGASKNGFAQNLANKLGIPVYAPNNFLWSDIKGKHFVASKSKANPNRPSTSEFGEFIKFIPGGNRK